MVANGAVTESWTPQNKGATKMKEFKIGDLVHYNGQIAEILDFGPGHNGPKSRMRLLVLSTSDADPDKFWASAQIVREIKAYEFQELRNELYDKRSKIDTLIAQVENAQAVAPGGVMHEVPNLELGRLYISRKGIILEVIEIMNTSNWPYVVRPIGQSKSYRVTKNGFLINPNRPDPLDLVMEASDVEAIEQNGVAILRKKFYDRKTGTHPSPELIEILRNAAVRANDHDFGAEGTGE